jgi:hypothetical protein
MRGAYRPPREARQPRLRLCTVLKGTYFPESGFNPGQPSAFLATKGCHNLASDDVMPSVAGGWPARGPALFILVSFCSGEDYQSLEFGTAEVHSVPGRPPWESNPSFWRRARTNLQI